MTKEEQKIYNIVSSNLSTLIEEYPDAEHVILECLYGFLYRPEVVDSRVIVKLYEDIPGDEAKDWIMTIKVNEGW